MFAPKFLESAISNSISNFAKSTAVFFFPIPNPQSASESFVSTKRIAALTSPSVFWPTKILWLGVVFLPAMLLCLCYEFQSFCFRHVLLLLSRPVYRSGCITIFAEKLKIQAQAKIVFQHKSPSVSTPKGFFYSFPKKAGCRCAPFAFLPFAYCFFAPCLFCLFF